MLRALWRWLFRAKKATPVYDRKAPFTLPPETTEDDVMTIVINHCWETGQFVFATRQDDGSVLVQEVIANDQWRRE